MSEVSTPLSDRLALFRNRRLYILPTRYGYIYALLLFIMLLGSMNYSNSLGHLLTFLLMSLGLVGMLYSYRNLHGLEIYSISSMPCFAGHAADVVLQINNSNQLSRYQLLIAERAEPVTGWNPVNRLRGYQDLMQVDQLIGNQTSAIQLHLPTKHRGWLTVNQFRLASTFPLGLFECWFYQAHPHRILVYPSPSGELPLPTSAKTNQAQAELEIKGQDDFAGLQRYRDGEPIYAIAWKAMARDEVMRSKQFSTTMGQQLVLDWDDTNPNQDKEKRLSQLCKWVLEAEKLGLQYGLKLSETLISPNRGQTHQHQCLKVLALYE